MYHHNNGTVPVMTVTAFPCFWREHKTCPYKHADIIYSGNKMAVLA